MSKAKPEKKMTAKKPNANAPAKAKTQTAEKKSAPRPVTAPSHDLVAALAYEIWKERGGDATENWLEAERRLR